MATRTKQKSKPSTAKPDWQQPRLQGKTFYLGSNDDAHLRFVDSWKQMERREAVALIRLEGGRIAKSVSPKIDYLVPSPEEGDLVAQAEKLNETKGASIAILDYKAFGTLFTPTRETAVAMLKAGAEGVERWKKLDRVNWPQSADLSGTDFRNCELNGVNLEEAIVDDCDFRGAQADGLSVLRVKGATFDRAVGRIEICIANGCSFKGCQLKGLSSFNYSSWELRDCDLQAADIAGVFNQGATAHKCNFDQVNFQDADFRSANVSHCSFRDADFSRAKLHECNFSSADLTGANLSNADLHEARLRGANLSGADLRGVNLMDADLSGATIDGANFEGAGVADADLSNLDLSRAEGLQESVAAVRAAHIGPRVKELERNATKTKLLQTFIDIGTADGAITLGIQVQDGQYISSLRDPITAEYQHWGQAKSNVSLSMAELVRHFPEGRLLPHTVRAKGTKSPLKGKALKQLCLEAWCELFGESVPTESELKQLAKSGKDGHLDVRGELYAELKGGKAGVAKWNKRPRRLRDEGGASRKLDLAGLDLSNLQGNKIDFEQSDFSGAKLKGASFIAATLKNTKFDQAQAAGVSFERTKLSDASCQRADLSKCNLRGSTLLRTNFSKANLAGADLQYTDLKGADFSGAKLSGAQFADSKFDEQTIFPKRFKLEDGLVWAGKGKDPRVHEKIAQVQTAGPIDFAAFMQQLEEECDASRLKKALKMLKADRFQLFAQVADDSVMGVVKSQTDAKLVYACRLDSEGTFACCTQNLNTCGGLRGALCKHLMVLIIGLTKEAELDSTTVNTWVAASGLQSPELDKDLMSEVFLKYKGAEAGEIDWRPTETVPEDYYAF